MFVYGSYLHRCSKRGGEGLKSCHETRAEEEIVCLFWLARLLLADRTSLFLATLTCSASYFIALHVRIPCATFVALFRCPVLYRLVG